MDLFGVSVLRSEPCIRLVPGERTWRQWAWRLRETTIEVLLLTAVFLSLSWCIPN